MSFSMLSCRRTVSFSTHFCNASLDTNVLFPILNDGKSARFNNWYTTGLDTPSTSETSVTLRAIFSIQYHLNQKIIPFLNHSSLLVYASFCYLSTIFALCIIGVQ